VRKSKSSGECGSEIRRDRSSPPPLSSGSPAPAIALALAAGRGFGVLSAGRSGGCPPPRAAMALPYGGMPFCMSLRPIAERKASVAPIQTAKNPDRITRTGFGVTAERFRCDRRLLATQTVPLLARLRAGGAGVGLDRRARPIRRRWASSAHRKDANHHSNLLHTEPRPMPYMQRHPHLVGRGVCTKACCRAISVLARCIRSRNHDCARSLGASPRSGVRAWIVARHELAPVDFIRTPICFAEAQKRAAGLQLPSHHRWTQAARRHCSAGGDRRCRRRPRIGAPPLGVAEGPARCRGRSLRSHRRARQPSERVNTCAVRRLGGHSELTDVWSRPNLVPARSDAGLPGHQQRSELAPSLPRCKRCPAPACGRTADPAKPPDQHRRGPITRIRGQVAVFVSRKETKIFVAGLRAVVRRWPLVIDSLISRLASHVFTAMEVTEKRRRHALERHHRANAGVGGAGA